VKALFVSNQQQQQLKKKLSVNNGCHLCVCTYVCECGFKKGPTHRKFYVGLHFTRKNWHPIWARHKYV